MRLSFLPALVLALLLPASLHAQTAPVASPAERIVARTGATVSPEARRYFGLVPDAPPGTAVDVASRPDGGLALTLRPPAEAATTRTLSPELAEDLARYVDRYEELYWDERDDSDVTWELGPSLTRLRREGLAVPATLKREVPFTYVVRLRNGDAVRGRVLYADESVVALWTGNGPYRWDALDGVALVPMSGIETASARAIGVVPLVLSAAMHVAAVATSTQRPPLSTGVAATLGAVGTGARAYGRLLTPQGAGVRTSLSRVAFFRLGTPPEFDARLSMQRDAVVTTPLPRRRTSAFDRWRDYGPFVSLNVSRGDASNAQDSVMTTATGTGSFPRPVPPYQSTGGLAAETADWRADAEVTLPLPVVPVGIVLGGSKTWFGDAPTLDADERYAAERLTERAQSSVHAGLSLGRASGPLLGNRFTVAYGIRRSEATLSGEFYSTLALDQGPPNNDPSAFARYSTTYKESTPFVRVAYDFMLTRVSSVFAVAEFAKANTIERPAQTVTSTYPDFGYSFTATRPAHTVTYGGRTLAAGLRLHL